MKQTRTARPRPLQALAVALFEGLHDGPWLLIELALGRYEIGASWHGQVVRGTTTIHRGDHHQIATCFGADGE